jgi:hypothetical protein
MSMKKFLLDWNKRSPDWFFITLLPLGISAVLIYITLLRTEPILSAITLGVEQLLTFCIILSSTDLGLRSRLESSNGIPRMSPAIIVGIAVTLLITLFSFKETITKCKLIYGYLLMAIILCYISLRMYDSNPRSASIDQPDVIKQHIDQQTNDNKYFEPKPKPIRRKK